ncbi:VOC family protein [Kineococcus gynurae]|uniref:VOC family protein n=1 Tax=Kineococcus gynurae TaxID=452979 RepID=A0ABV5LSD8_9ACTN
MAQLNPYLHLDTTAREAMTFYQGVLGGELSIMTFGDMGAPEGVDPEGVMHAQLDVPGGITLMASDLPPGADPVPVQGMTVSISGDEVDTLRGWFSGLSEGGQIQMPLEKQMWGDEMGAFVDRFGVPWLINISLGGAPE